MRAQMPEYATTVTIYSDGSYYVGSTADPEECHDVVIYWPNGDKKFVGTIHQGDPVRGRWFFKNMDQYVGELKDGKFHGEGTYIYCAGRRYDGSFHRGEYHGRGRLTQVGCLVYEGDFKSGQYHGVGRRRWSDGRLYIGEFQNGEEHGEGTLYAENGTVEDSGRWIYGALVKSFYA